MYTRLALRTALISGHLLQTNSFSGTEFLDMNSHIKYTLITKHYRTDADTNILPDKPGTPQEPAYFYIRAVNKTKAKKWLTT